ncbi:MAG: LTA synthase family protein, partial [Selenomonas sp.]|nr:LTA synthase family protein [Selenomonas sp.]
MNQRGRMASFYDAIQRDLCLFVFILLTLCVYRAYFMFAMAGYIAPETSSADIGLALFTGLRLSLKTAGWIALPSFVFCSLPLLAAPRLTALLGRLRLFWGTLAAFVFAVLFQARFPFYRQFHSGFQMQMDAGMEEDPFTIVSMLVQEYGLLWRMGIAILLTLVSFWILRRLLCAWKVCALPRLRGTMQRALFSLGLFLFFCRFFLFVRFGGSFTYGGGSTGKMR